MSATNNILTDENMTLTAPAENQIAELISQVEDDIKGVRVYLTQGGCSGMGYGMTFTDQIDENDFILECDGFNLIVDNNAVPYLRGVEIDYVDRGDGNWVFQFNNVQPMESGSACGGCSSAGSCG
jgi:iron-sulfur cluster insertion protein